MVENLWIQDIEGVDGIHGRTLSPWSASSFPPLRNTRFGPYGHQYVSIYLFINVKTYLYSITTWISACICKSTYLALQMSVAQKSSASQVTCRGKTSILGRIYAAQWYREHCNWSCHAKLFPIHAWLSNPMFFTSGQYRFMFVQFWLVLINVIWSMVVGIDWC